MFVSKIVGYVIPQFCLYVLQEEQRQSEEAAHSKGKMVVMIQAVTLKMCFTACFKYWSFISLSKRGRCSESQKV